LNEKQREFGVHWEINKSWRATKWKRIEKGSGLNSGVLRSKSTFRNTESRVCETKQHVDVGFEAVFVLTLFG
jgi:hypothetical protein